MSNDILQILLNIERELGEIKSTGVTTLEQATKTNGRVTSLEDTHRELARIVSRHNGVLLKWEKNTEDKAKIWNNFYSGLIGYAPKTIIFLLLTLIALAFGGRTETFGIIKTFIYNII